MKRIGLSFTVPLVAATVACGGSGSDDASGDANAPGGNSSGPSGTVEEGIQNLIGVWSGHLEGDTAICRSALSRYSYPERKGQMDLDFEIAEGWWIDGDTYRFEVLSMTMYADLLTRFGGTCPEAHAWIRYEGIMTDGPSLTVEWDVDLDQVTVKYSEPGVQWTAVSDPFNMVEEEVSTTLFFEYTGVENTLGGDGSFGTFSMGWGNPTQSLRQNGRFFVSSVAWIPPD